LARNAGVHAPHRLWGFTLLLAVIGALLFGAFNGPSLLSTSAHAEETQITEGSLDWGVKASFRAYVGAGNITASDGVTVNEDGTFHWPIESGTFDDEGNLTSIQLGGSVNFYGHEGALNLTVSRPKFEVTATGGTLYLDMAGLNLDGTSFDTPGAPALTLDVLSSAPVVDAGVTTWTDVPTSLTADGVSAFAGFYSVGTVMDPATLTYTGQGGKPVFDEAWDPAGTPMYEVTADYLAPGLWSPLRVMPDAAHGIIHALTTYSAPTVIQALDEDTLTLVASATLPWDLRNSAGWFDPAWSTFYVTPRSGDGLWSFTWDNDTKTYS
jgi:hypothetical protein